MLLPRVPLTFLHSKRDVVLIVHNLITLVLINGFHPIPNLCVSAAAPEFCEWVWIVRIKTTLSIVSGKSSFISIIWTYFCCWQRFLFSLTETSFISNHRLILLCNLLTNKTNDSISSQSPHSLEHLVNCKCIPLTGKSAIPSLRNGLEELTSACDKAIFLLNGFYHLSSRTYLPLMTYGIINM